jgi:UDP-glucose 4-epimerase
MSAKVLINRLSITKKNTAGTICLLKAMLAANVAQLVFSSTCATYGEPEAMPIVETTPQVPINPYGWSKLFVERVLRDTLNGHPRFSFTVLRYFNVAGAAADGSIGEHHDPETHLIPLVIQAAQGKREAITIFGNDYPTPDGTCIRDCMHVDDLCGAHILAMEQQRPGRGEFYNLGIGHGYSLKQVIESVRRVGGRQAAVEFGGRRPGDPPRLFANSTKIQSELGWRPEYTDLDGIVRTAWAWHESHPNGYAEVSRV